MQIFQALILQIVLFFVHIFSFVLYIILNYKYLHLLQFITTIHFRCNNCKNPHPLYTLHISIYLPVR